MAKKRVRVVAKKKIWVQLLAPALFNNQVIGETYVVDQRQVLKKRVRVNLMTLMKMPRKQNISVTFLVTGLHENKGTTEIISYRINPSAVKRMLRRKKAKVEDSFACYTLDRIKIRVKPILITRSKAPKSVLSKLRQRLRDVIARYAAKTNYRKVMRDIVEYKLQKTMFDTVRKMYPIAVCEIRWIKLADKELKPASEEEVKEAREKEAAAAKKAEEKSLAEEKSATEAEEPGEKKAAKEAEKPKKE